MMICTSTIGPDQDNTPSNEETKGQENILKQKTTCRPIYPRILVALVLTIKHKIEKQGYEPRTPGCTKVSHSASYPSQIVQHSFSFFQKKNQNLSKKCMNE
jgi:hypothetical protein